MEKEAKFDLNEELKKCKIKDGLFKRGGSREMKSPVGYIKSSPQGHLSGNSRNGYNSKRGKSNAGEIDLD